VAVYIFWDFKENGVCQRFSVHLLELMFGPDPQIAMNLKHRQAGKRDTIGPAIQPD
jgi:hypothetical protein